jgi:hypothetical protein
MKTSNLFSLNWADFGKGLLMAILTPAMVVIQQSLDAGVFVFDWKSIGLGAFAGGFAYLVKNFFTAAPVQKLLDESESIGNPFPKRPR